MLDIDPAPHELMFELPSDRVGNFVRVSPDAKAKGEKLRAALDTAPP